MGSESMNIQAQLRHRVEEQNDILKDLGKWEESITKKDSSIRSLQEGGTREDYYCTRKKNDNINPSQSNNLKEPIPSLQNIQSKDNSPANSSKEDLEIMERKIGNEHYGVGDFAKAVRCYTRCLELNPKSLLAFSNRGKMLMLCRIMSNTHNLSPTQVKRKKATH